jgi:hypothetical protein
MKIGTIQRAALSRLFSPTVFRDMAQKGRSPLFSRLLLEADVLKYKIDLSHTISSAFDTAFSILQQTGIRDEYIFRSAITKNIFLSRHSLKTASMLTEFRAGLCKADIVILNGTSTVYEIKSDRDSLCRLPNQISNYQKVFGSVYVIAGKSHVNEVLDITSSEVGVMELVAQGRIRTVRKAIDCSDRVCSASIFESLRIEEARQILKNTGTEVADVSNIFLRSTMRDCFTKIEPKLAHDQMVKVLRKTRNLASLSDFIFRLPISLHAAGLSFNVRKADHQRLISTINTPLDVAITWA